MIIENSRKSPDPDAVRWQLSAPSRCDSQSGTVPDSKKLPRFSQFSHGEDIGANKVADTVDETAPISHGPGNIELILRNNMSTSQDDCSGLNPNVPPFRMRDSSLLHRGVLVLDLDSDWEQVQRV